MIVQPFELLTSEEEQKNDISKRTQRHKTILIGCSMQAQRNNDIDRWQSCCFGMRMEMS